MPKRQTILYTSNDAPRSEGVQLFVYYCKYSGKHAFTTGQHRAGGNATGKNTLTSHVLITSCSA